MELLTKPLVKTDKSTISMLYVDGVYECNVLEDKDRSEEQLKIWGQTAIPAGRYEIIINQSARFTQLRGKPTFLPLLLNVPGFEGVRIHSGNRPEDTEGCLLVGVFSKNAPNWVSNSLLSLTRLQPKIQKALDSGDKVFITITR